MLQNCKKILSSNGKIIFTTPNPNSFLVRLGRNKVFKDPSHLNLMSIKTFKSYINESGLKISRIEGCGRMRRFIKKFPLINIYGSYMSVLSN
jgi:hypothetical protein